MSSKEIALMEDVAQARERIKWLLAEQRRRDAELVRAAGCICLIGRREFGDWRWIGPTLTTPGTWKLFEHDLRCPEALASRIEDGEVSHG